MSTVFIFVLSMLPLSPLHQGSHSTCCAWSCPDILPCLMAPTALVVDSVSNHSSLLQVMSSALTVGIVLN